MLRFVIENTLLFLLPTVLYCAYVWVARKSDPGRPILDPSALVWLMAIGAALVLATIFIFGSFEGGQPDQGYRPPQMKDGRIEPGGVK
jgi:nicotinamide riboside transporter PnuC